MSKETPRVLIVDDDLTLCELLSDFLTGEGFSVDTLHDGRAVTQYKDLPDHFDAIVLDIMMPGMSGLEVLQSLRPQINTPVIMLTGRGDDIDKIIGIEMGADDYLAKPCNPKELSVRIKAILRRVSSQAPVAQKTTIDIHGIHLDVASRAVSVDGRGIEMTSAEFNTLHLLMQNAGTVLSKEELTEKVLHRKLSAYDRSIDVHVSRVRQKIAVDEARKNLIKTIRGQGYQFITHEV